MEDESGLGCMAHPLYLWQLKHINSTARMTFSCAANQVGKSVANWIRLLRFCYLRSYWDKFFCGQKPPPFWYFYPSASISTAEIKEKYIKNYFPHPDLKDHERWGYKINQDKKVIHSIEFATGTSVYFKNYTQIPDNLQTATLGGVFGDEEMPEKIFDELIFRGVSRENFYYNNVFTATLGQEYLRKTIEVKGDGELFPDAMKQQITMFDCLKYADGTPSRVFTKEKIAQTIAACTSPEQVQRRVYGRFVLSENRKFHAFNIDRNVEKGHPIPSKWLIYAGIDWGSGGDTGHPSALVYLGVSTDFKKGRVFLTWRGDGIPTTQGDLVTKHVQLTKDLNVLDAAYDYSATDVGTIASRIGISLTKADKSRDTSVELINTLFKNNQLKIYTGDGYSANEKLVSELIGALNHGPKTKDDLIDALRYAVTLVPWQFEMQLADDSKEEITQGRKLSPREKFWRYGHGDELSSDDDFMDDGYQQIVDYYGN